MGAPQLSNEDFVGALQALLPKGHAWSRDSDAVFTALLAGLAPSFARQSARSAYLLQDAFPATTYELLTEWEETLGLPDPCAGEAPTIAQRVAQVVARFAYQGGQSVPFFIAYAAALGYTITITEFSETHQSGYTSATTAPTTAVGWANTWQVNCSSITNRYFLADIDVCGEQLVTTDGGEVLQCEFQRIAPAHTNLVFSPS